MALCSKMYVQYVQHM